MADDMTPWQSACTTYMSMSININQPLSLGAIRHSLLSPVISSGYFHFAVFWDEEGYHMVNSTFAYSSTKCWLS